MIYLSNEQNEGQTTQLKNKNDDDLQIRILLNIITYQRNIQIKNTEHNENTVEHNDCSMVHTNKTSVHNVNTAKQNYAPAKHKNKTSET